MGRKRKEESGTIDNYILQPLYTLEEAGIAARTVGGSTQIHVAHFIAHSTKESIFRPKRLPPEGQPPDGDNRSSDLADRIPYSASVCQPQQQGDTHEKAAQRKDGQPFTGKDRRWQHECAD